MRIIIIGAGRVGQTLIDNLQEENDLILVDTDNDRLDELAYEYEVLTINGDGTKLEVLEKAGIDRADMVIASTGDERTNIVACGTAKTTTDVFTIARVKRRSLLNTWQQTEKAYNVDFMVCSDLLAAEAIFRVAGVPRALDTDTFGSGLIRMAEFEISEDIPLAGSTIETIDDTDRITYAGIIRDGNVIVPDGQTTIAPGDRIIVIGSPEQIRKVAEMVAGRKSKSLREVAIIGGSEVGFQAARVFQQHGYKTRLVERDRTKAREIAEILPKVTVLHHDATDIDFLEREHIHQADIVVTALNRDERNLLVGLVSGQLGASRTVSLVHQPKYGRLFETVGIDAAVSAREETAEEITRFTRRSGTEKVALIEEGAEIIELRVGPESGLLDRSIAEADKQLSPPLVIGGVVRDGQFITPRGDVEIEIGDHVVIFARSEDVNELLSHL